RGVKGEEKGEQDSGDKTADQPGRKTVAVPKALVLPDPGILDGLMDPQAGDQGVGHAVKDFGMLPKEGQDQKIGHQNGGSHYSEADGQGYFIRGRIFTKGHLNY